MPLYDYTCERCGLAFEVSRSFKDADIGADCPVCEVPAKRELSLPMTTFTRGAASESLRQQPLGGGGSRWSHHGHSHAPGEGGHSH
jgi:putative FmdB family regulatory protein